MSSSEPNISAVSIVAVGSFNPAIFSPLWFSSQDLVPGSEADDAEVEAILPGIARFRLSWLDVMVVPQRLAMSTHQPQTSRTLRDLVMSTFRLLRHTPITQLGINRDSHFELGSEARLLSIGEALVPNNPFGDTLNEPKVASLRTTGQRTDDLSGAYNVTVESSLSVTNGIYIGTNDHYEIDASDELSSAEVLVALLDQEWDSAIRRSVAVCDQVLTLG